MKKTAETQNIWRKAEEAAKLYEQMVNDYIYLSKRGLKVEAARLEVKLLTVREVAKQLIKAAEQAQALLKRKRKMKPARNGPGPKGVDIDSSMAIVWHLS